MFDAHTSGVGIAQTMLCTCLVGQRCGPEGWLAPPVLLLQRMAQLAHPLLLRCHPHQASGLHHQRLWHLRLRRVLRGQSLLLLCLHP